MRRIFVRICDKNYKYHTICLNGLKNTVAVVEPQSAFLHLYYENGNCINVYMKTYEEALDTLYKIKQIYKRFKNENRS